jgi:hypothetical protein
VGDVKERRLPAGRLAGGLRQHGVAVDRVHVDHFVRRTDEHRLHHDAAVPRHAIFDGRRVPVGRHHVRAPGSRETLEFFEGDVRSGVCVDAGEDDHHHHRRRECGTSVTLGGPSDDRAENAARNHDLPPVVTTIGIRHGGDCEREHESDDEAEDDSLRNRLHSARVPARGDSRDHAFDRRADDDAQHLLSHFRGKPRCCAVDQSEYGPDDQSYQNLVHVSFLRMRIQRASEIL